MSEANAGRVYGFYKESYDNDVAIDTLMTGDGKALFTDLSFDKPQIDLLHKWLIKISFADSIPDSEDGVLPIQPAMAQHK